MTRWAMLVPGLVLGAVLLAACTPGDGADAGEAATTSTSGVDRSVETPTDDSDEQAGAPTTGTTADDGPAPEARPGPQQTPDPAGPIELWLGRGEMTDRSITMHWALDERLEPVGFTLHRLPFNEGVDPMVVPLDPSTVIERGDPTSAGVVDDDVQTGSRYWYVLLAEDSTGTEHRRATDADAITDEQPPTPVTGVSAEVDDGGVTLSWDQSTDDYRFGRYTIRRSVDGAGSIYYGTGWTADQTTFIDDRPPPAGSQVVYEIGATDFHDNATEPTTVEVTIG